MPRAAALANQFADALKASLLLIDSVGSPTLYLTKPAQVLRGLRSSNITQDPTPLIAIEVIAARSSADTMGDSHAYAIDCEVHCVTRAATTAEQTALNLAADVEYRLSQDEYLGALLLEPIIDYVIALNVELSQMTGLAVFTVAFTAKARYDHSTTLP